MVYRAGPKIMQGLFGALLAISALARVHKVCTIISKLTTLPHQEGQSPGVYITSWLHHALGHLPQGEPLLIDVQ